ncbi:LacI family transcriptional regulator [Actinoplanes sp. OR16]|uniref:LacI family DNA-binding transcriptional regulator n=1 Tax=Actinoplanes sp. OR16 TaxID=946334 RepID=UPI000F6BA2F1|nr:LacI family DNA-binding transcriptional regulator [Actinoplanes sp. OR16]BBH67959.1 LacI family transcriptional regulator [Actinoplanes sp. OR16]
MARIEDVAARAGVSVGTVSNVLNRPHAVAPKTRARVEAAITELGYLPNESARALVSGRSRTVGLVVPDVTNPFFADLARGAEEVADKHDVVVMLYNSADSIERELRYLGRLETQRVQGILVTPVDRGGRAVEDLISRGTPVVLLDRGQPSRNVCSVTVDHRAGGRLAGTHLTELGHRRIAFLGGPLSAPQVADRLDGARQAATAAGAVLETIETSALTVAAGREAAGALALRDAGERPSAVFCANDLLALGVLQTVTREGLRVPEDLAIVGYDDIEFAAAAAVPLTSVRQPREQLGRVAAELLFEEIHDAGRHGHRQVAFQPELVVRRS